MTTQTAPQAQITKPSDREIHVERVFDAPRELVWKAYTDPKLIAQWWGRGNPLDVERMEVKKGGHWRFIERGPDETHGFEGRYAEVIPKEKIVQTFEWDGMPGYPLLDTAVFQDVGGNRTKVVSTSLFYTKQGRDGMFESGMSEGLNQSYAALDRLLERLR